MSPAPFPSVPVRGDFPYRTSERHYKLWLRSFSVLVGLRSGHGDSRARLCRHFFPGAWQSPLSCQPSRWLPVPFSTSLRVALARSEPWRSLVPLPDYAFRAKGSWALLRLDFHPFSPSDTSSMPRRTPSDFLSRSFRPHPPFLPYTFVSFRAVLISFHPTRSIPSPFFFSDSSRRSVFVGWRRDDAVKPPPG